MIILETPRLFLRHFHIGDAVAMSNVLGDPEVMKFGNGAMTIKQIYEWLSKRLKHYYESWGFGLWAVVNTNDQEVIGYCGLTHFPDINGNSEIEIGYRLKKSAWGNGYATEASLAVRDYGFKTLCLSRLIALVDPNNLASIRVAEKLGMIHEGEVMLPGYDHCDYVYAVAKPRG